MTDPLARLTTLLSRLPGLGEKSALRLALAITDADDAYTTALADAIRDAANALRLCSVCCDLTTEPVCSICTNKKRNPKAICVVSRPQDRMALERAAVFQGRYHVLHGVLDPLSGVGPSELHIRELLERLKGADSPEEIIVATSPTVEGDATAVYLAALLGPIGVRVSRIASGVAVGADVEYADMTTLHRAIEDRRELTTPTERD